MQLGRSMLEMIAACQNLECGRTALPQVIRKRAVLKEQSANDVKH